MNKDKKMDAIPDEGGLLTVKQAAKLLNLSRKTIYELHASGQLEMLKLGRATRIPEASVRKFVAALPRRVPAGEK